MPALPPPSTIGRYSASSRSFLLGPDGPAGAPPGQGLRSGALIELRENPEQEQDPYYKVSTVSGEPRGLVAAVQVDGDAHADPYPLYLDNSHFYWK
jgi:hypothetical protein